MTKIASRSRKFASICFPTRKALGLAFLVCVVVPTVLVALQINEHPKFSPSDEGAHWDYVTRISNGEGVPRLGELLQKKTLKEIACRETETIAAKLVPKCSSQFFNAAEFPGGGQQYQAQHPPTYYALTVPLRWVAIEIFGFDDLTGTRYTGILWLVAGLLVLWAAGRVMGLTTPTIGVGVLLLTTAPVVIYHASTVSNDAPAIFTGALIALVAALAYRYPGQWTIALAAVGFFSASVKLTGLLPVFAVSAAFAIQAWGSSRSLKPRDTIKTFFRRWLPQGGALLFGGLVAALLWIITSRQLALIDSKDLIAFDILRTRPVSPMLILNETTRLLSPITDSYVSPDTLSQDLQAFFTQLLKALVLAGGLSGLFVSARKWNHWIGITALGSLVIGGALFGASLKLIYQIDPGLSGRYGLAVGPLLILALVAGASGVWVIRALWLFALASTITTFCVLVF